MEPAGSTEVRTVDATKPEEVFYVAHCYRRSAHILWEKIGKIFAPVTVADLIPDLLPPTGVPGLILDCLSIEIFLKCLLQLESGSAATQQGHNLIDLFASVSQVMRNRIKVIFDSLDPPGNDPSMWVFDVVMSSLNKAFVTWRYAYEYAMRATTYDYRLAISIEKAILELRPDWKRLTEFRVKTTSPVR